MITASFSFSPINWSGQTPGTGGTSHVNNSAARSDRNAARRTANALRGNQQAQPLMGGPARPMSAFEEINNFVAAVQSGDSVAASALLGYGNSATSRAVAAGPLAQGRRR